MASTKFSLSQYAQLLEFSVKAQYLSKIETIKEDPNLLRKSDLDEYLNDLPSVDYTDIVYYLMLLESKGGKGEGMMADL